MCVYLAFILSFTCKSPLLNSPWTESCDWRRNQQRCQNHRCSLSTNCVKAPWRRRRRCSFPLSTHFAVRRFLCVPWNSLSKYFLCSSSWERNCKLKQKEDKWENKGKREDEVVTWKIADFYFSRYGESQLLSRTIFGSSYSSARHIWIAKTVIPSVFRSLYSRLDSRLRNCSHSAALGWKFLA